MSEFVGRTGSNRVYSYPNTGGARGGSGASFARNFATGPKTGTSVGVDGILVPWNGVDVATSTPTTDVPITPKSTGIVIISGVISLGNSSGSPISEVIIQIQISGGSFFPTQASFGAPLVNNGSITIPFLAETTPTDTPVGVKSFVQVFVDATNATLLAEASALQVQEVPAATG